MSDVKPHGQRRNPEQEPPGKAGARVEGLNFDDWFKRATGNDPFPYQRCFATEGEIPELVDVPTAVAKTAMAVLGWLWRKRASLSAGS